MDAAIPFMKKKIIEMIRVVAASIPGRSLPARFKYTAEILFWKSRQALEGGRLKNDHYQDLMLAMANEKNFQFLRDKIVADFGCGPRGSLSWAISASRRIGIDVLAEKYQVFGLEHHHMEYCQSSETKIPLDDESIDVLFSLNSLDHVNHFELMCREILRILKPGGHFIGSINLDESATFAEPQQLTEELVDEHLLNYLKVVSKQIAPKGPREDEYIHLLNDVPEPDKVNARILWVRGEKTKPAVD